VPKDISGLITVDAIDSQIKNVLHIGFLQPFKTPVVLSTGSTSDFTAPLFIADGMLYSDYIDLVYNGSGKQIWTPKVGCGAVLMGLVEWKSSIHPPFDYDSRKRARSVSEVVPTRDVLYGKSYFPGGENIFGIEGDGPILPVEINLNPPDASTKQTPSPKRPSKKQRVGTRKRVSRDPIARHILLVLRRDLYIVPLSGPVNVPDIFGGTITVEQYIRNNYASALAFLSIKESSMTAKRREALLGDSVLLITRYNNYMKQTARTQLEGNLNVGGYGLLRSMSDEEKSELAGELLKDNKYLHRNGLDHTADDLLFTHDSLRHLCQKWFTSAKIARAVHPRRISGQTIEQYFNIPVSGFPLLGVVQAGTVIHDGLRSIEAVTGVGVVRALQRSVLYAEINHPSNREAKKVWSGWDRKQDPFFNLSIFLLNALNRLDEIRPTRAPGNNAIPNRGTTAPNRKRDKLPLLNLGRNELPVLEGYDEGDDDDEEYDEDEYDEDEYDEDEYDEDDEGDEDDEEYDEDDEEYDEDDEEYDYNFFDDLDEGLFGLDGDEV
ncbi:hypothetical protein BDZ94DRAFT_1304555, partial [Collybia nuda]